MSTVWVCDQPVETRHMNGWFSNWINCRAN